MINVHLHSWNSDLFPLEHIVSINHIGVRRWNRNANKCQTKTPYIRNYMAIGNQGFSLFRSSHSCNACFIFYVLPSKWKVSVSRKYLFVGNVFKMPLFFLELQVKMWWERIMIRASTSKLSRLFTFFMSLKRWKAICL